MKILLSALVSACIALPGAAAFAQPQPDRAQPDRGTYDQRQGDQRAGDRTQSYDQRQSSDRGRSYDQGRHRHRQQVCRIRHHRRVCYWR
ncbi:MAG: hypothetical protein JWR43_350 [Phenylobacterium sp.]|jgi:Ni/Co efflux regulator RcnB|nr:hypothetical protein [Phenylobacterium sp.]